MFSRGSKCNNKEYTILEGRVERKIIESLRVTDSKYRESLDKFEKSKTLKLCVKNAFREFSSKILFRFSKNLTSSRNSQKTKIHLFTSLNMQKISGKLTKFSVFALKQFTILEHGINLAQKFHLFFYLTIGSFIFFPSNLKDSVDSQRIAFSSSYANGKSCVFLRS